MIHTLDCRLWRIACEVLGPGERETCTCRACGRMLPVAVRVRPDDLWGKLLESEAAVKAAPESLCAGCALDRLMARWPYLGEGGISYGKLERKDMDGPRWLGQRRK